jgi:hypothetical protein
VAVRATPRVRGIERPRGPPGAARPDELAHEYGLDLLTTRQVLCQLVSDEFDLIRELPPESPDLGPRYEVKDTV